MRIELLRCCKKSPVNFNHDKYLLTCYKLYDFFLITLRQIGSYGKDKDSTEVIPRKTFHFPFEEKTRRKCQEQHNGRKGYEEENPNLF